MKPNAFQVYKLDHEGITRAVSNPFPTLETAEASLERQMPKDVLGDRTYIILPIYTNIDLSKYQNFAQQARSELSPA